ncbi:putative NADPH-dependent alpha-keto amide reductase [Xylaria sp. FL1777]|nr:putative NADPH-dependent alpha-keto amide reductase [Xylaria sp. FL1777]
MEDVKKAGKVKSIGVSNYLRPNVEATLQGATDSPVINQLEYHPYLQPRIAKAHYTTEAVILLARVVQNNIVAITATTKPGRFDEYAQALEVELNEEEKQKIADIGSAFTFVYLGVNTSKTMIDLES